MLVESLCTPFSSLPLQMYIGRSVFRRAIPVAARSKAWVCDLPLAGIADSNPVGGMNVCLL